MAYLTRYNKTSIVDYTNLVVKKADSPIINKRLFVLGAKMDLYQNNTPASSFLNWDLSKNIFEGPDYYKNVTEVYRSFKKDVPEVIVDENDLLQPFFNRIPELSKRYVKDGVVYTRNN
ncbi:hypothetical protein [Chryseosolibacter indicus]|uniref:Uncharacterized protein n=1 Tax=Chryseosolibacter indicus TaxID=2782351 RepID=A0ABS5VWL2_9BACT|nr:hypothetical protein [Chryseosolibacter indicus]MBT1705443.1 hypothetical protein [Chryseosolibacter indicus]